MKKIFGTYLCSFKHDDHEIKANKTYVNGEVDMTEDCYKDLTVEEACRKRLSTEYDAKSTGGTHLSNNLDWDTFSFEIVEVDWDEKQKGVDKKLHKYYEDKGIRRLRDSITGRLTEEFDFGPNARQIMLEAIEYCFGPLKEESYKLRNVQAACVEKMMQAINSGYSSFLVALLPRKGKDVTALHFCAENKFKNILFITAKCDALKSVQNDWRRFFCEKYTFILKEDIKNRKIQNDERKRIVAVSMQSSAIDLHDDDNGENEDAKIDVVKNADNVSLLNELGKYAWDALIIDECHFGIDTNRSKETLEKILKNSPNCFKIEMSATPFKKLTSGDYQNNAFIYDIYSEAIDPDNDDAKKSHDYSKYVPIVNYHLNFFDWLKNGTITNLKGNGRNSFKNKKIFQELITEKIKEWEVPFSDFVFSWDSFFSDSAGFNEDSISSMFVNLYECVFSRYAKNAKTFAIYVNQIKHGKKLANALNKSNKFKVINVCGDNRTGIDELNRKLENSVLDDNEKPVIMISCSRYLTASTLKYLDCVIFMGTCNSPENFVQYESRAKNTRDGRKCPCYVFDLNPETILVSEIFLKDLLIPKAKYEKKSVDQVLQDIKYNKDCFEMLEIINENDVNPIDLSTEMHNIFYKKEIFKNKDLIEKVIGVDKLKAMAISINLHDLLIDASVKEKNALFETIKQTNGRPKKQKQKNKNENEKKGKNTYISDIDKFLNVCDQTVLMMHTYDLQNINDILKSSSNILTWHIHTQVSSELFDRINKWSSENDNGFTWNSFCIWFQEETERLTD